MLTIPVTDKTFVKGFAGGSGALELTFTGSTGLASAIDPTAPFPDEAKTLVAAKAAGSTPELKFGSDTVACTATFSGETNLSLTLARPGDGTALPAAATPPGEGRLGVLLSVGARAKATAAAKVVAPAGFSFGVSAGAGANVSFDRYLEFAGTAPARSIVGAILADIRLPQSRGSAPDVPQPGEVVEFAYSGFLDLAASLNWGYSLTASESFHIRDIQARVDYALRAKAALTLGYRLAGDFNIALTRGHADGWARLAVSKRRDTRFQAAAGFDFTAKADVSGFSDVPNEFLGAFLGTDVKSVLNTLDSAVEATDLEALQKKVGKLLSGVVTELAEKWSGGAIDSPQVGTILANIRQAVDAYSSIDEQIVHTVMELYDKTLGPRKDVLERALRVVSALSGPADLMALKDQDAWALIQQIVGGDLHSLISGASLEPFARLQRVAAAVLRLAAAPPFEKLRDVIAAARARLKLDELFGALEKVKTAQDLRQLRDETLQGLVERIVGKSFDAIGNSELGKVAGEVNKTLTGLKKFKDDFAAHAQKALHQSVELRINFLYARATSDQALIDVEIDVNAPGGSALFADAAGGRISPLFAAAQQGRVLVHEALLTHEVTRSSQLQFNAFGWEFKRLVDVVSRSEVALQSHAGGLVQVFTNETTLKEMQESGRAHKESLQANLLLRFAGETFGTPSDSRNRDYLIRTLERMSVGYDLVQSDDMTDTKELTECLELGKQLGLVQEGLIPELVAQFGTRLGKVRVSYTVRFDSKAIQDAFVATSGDALDRLVRQTARRLVAGALVTRDKPHQALIGLAYLSEANAQKNRNNTLENSPVVVTLPGFITGGASRSVSFDRDDPQMAILRTLFNVETTLARRVVRLDKAVDDARMAQRAVSIDELESAAKDVLEAGGSLDKFGAPNTFFGVFDALIRVGGLGKSHRESALILQITPPGGDTVTRFFMDNPAVPAGADA